MTTIDDFIKRLQQVSEDKRKLPLIIIAPNGLECEPKIKMKFEEYGFTLESMVITY